MAPSTQRGYCSADRGWASPVLKVGRRWVDEQLCARLAGAALAARRVNPELPRGDTPLFFLQITAAVVSSVGTLYAIKLVFGSTVGAFPSLIAPALAQAQRDAEPADSPYDYDEYGESAT